MANPYAPPSTVQLPIRPEFAKPAAAAFASPRTGVVLALQACVALSAVMIPVVVWQKAVIDGGVARDFDAGLDALHPVDFILVGVGLLQMLTYVTTVVLWGMWSVRANKNMRALEPGGYFRFTPGWTVGWFFIPIAWLFKPFQAVKEMLVRSSTDGFSKTTVLGWWWAAWLIGNIVSHISLRLGGWNETPAQTSMLAPVNVVAEALTVASGICAVIIIRTINKNQLELRRRQS